METKNRGNKKALKHGNKRFHVFLFAAVIIGAAAFGIRVDGIPVHHFATALLADSKITPAYLHQKYAGDEQIRVLIVPGHDDASSGAWYGGVREADITLALSEDLADLLKRDDMFAPVLARNRTGYAANFEHYYLKNRTAIERFRMRLQEIMRGLLSDGTVTRLADQASHTSVPSWIANRLYGINKYANDIGADIVLHVHFNADELRRYSGFAVYIPEKQLPNHEASNAIAASLYGALGKFLPASDSPAESSGIVEDQDLIAVGANGSLDPPSLLIEYGFMSETQAYVPRVRALALREYAYQTYRGLKRFFDTAAVARNSFRETETLPHTWRRQLVYGTKHSPDVFALQMALARDGFYPLGARPSNCPITGNYGPCTEVAVRAFQKAHGISPVGRVGPQTVAQLNEVYSYTTAFR